MEKICALQGFPLGVFVASLSELGSDLIATKIHWHSSTMFEMVLGVFWDKSLKKYGS